MQALCCIAAERGRARSATSAGIHISPRSSMLVARCTPPSRMTVRNLASGVMSFWIEKCMSSSAFRNCCANPRTRRAYALSKSLSLRSFSARRADKTDQRDLEIWSKAETKVGSLCRSNISITRSSMERLLLMRGEASSWAKGLIRLESRLFATVSVVRPSTPTTTKT